MATHTDVYSAHPGQPIGRPAAEHMGSMLEQLTAQMQTRIADVERRHADALHELQAKLERMSGTANKARPAMPAELAMAFERVEAGMADLVDRIAEAAPERRRGAEAFVFGAAKPESSHFVFDPPRRDPVAPVAFETFGAGGEPWDPTSAEALARLYESGEALLVKHLPEAALFAPGQWAQQHEGGNRAEPDAVPAPIEVMPAMTRQVAPSAIVAAGLGEDRQWLDQKLSDMAEHVSKSVGDARPDAALNTLMSRVDQLESRFCSALEGIAKTTDVAALRTDSLKQVEFQIGELAGHIEETRQQLTRLDAIEQHLSDLTAYAHAAMDADGAATSAAAPDMTHDFAQLADLAVERALSRTPAATGEAVAPAETQARVDAVHALLQEFAAERRRGDQYTSGMLETVQEALVRLIDRVDAIDGAVNRVPDPGHPAAALPPQVAQVTAAMPIAPTLAPEVPSALADEPLDAIGKSKLRRRARTSEQPSAAASTITPTSNLEGERVAQPEISIKDLKLNQKSTRSTAPAASADANAPTDAATNMETAPKPARSARAPSVQPATTGGGTRRALYVATAALSLVGIGFMAQHLYSGGSADPSAASVTAVPARAPLAADLNKAATIAPSPVAGSPVSPATRPPGMVTTPPRPESAAQPSVTVVPSAQAGSPPVGQRQEPVQPRRLDAPAVVVPSQPRGPASIPETVSDDLSMIDVEDNNSVIAPASTPGAPRPEPSGRSLATLQPIQGLAIAGDQTMTTPQQISDFTGLQRQSRQAAASEQVGFNARPASDFSHRFGTNAPAPAAVAATPVNQAAAIVTGSTMVPRAMPDSSVTDAVPETADLPPALVGPLSLRMAAAKGEPSAAFEVATRFAEGRGIKQDFKQAMVWYQRSAGKGFAIAQYRLGTLYERGLGTPVDVARARLWYKRAADQGNVKAMHNMAVLSAGNGQAAPDYAGAAKWFKEAADRGLADSQFNLGVLYENGLGIEKDPSTAYVWFSLAARNGDAEAVRRRDQLLATLDAEAVRIANDRVQNWHARATNSKVNDARVAGDQWRSQSAQLEEAVPQIQPSPFTSNVGNPSPAPRTVKAPTPAR